ncbi:MAG: hypothetical protein V9G09_07395 [Candidatus Nanopelagicales bacterium]
MSDITLVEVGPRDGLQNEAVVFDTDTKVEFINRCLAAGARRIEVASFVNPKRVPQMADAEAVLDRLAPGAASYIGLVLNERGFDRALATQVGEVNLVVMVTDTFSLKNQGMTTAEAVAAVAAIAPRARDAGIPVSVTLSASFGCPYEGEVDVARLVDVAAQVAAVGIDELADRRHHRCGGPAGCAQRGCQRCATPYPCRCGCTCTTPATPATQARSRPPTPGSACSTPRSAGSGAARSRPGPPATSQRRTWCSPLSVPGTTRAWTSTRCAGPVSG